LIYCFFTFYGGYLQFHAGSAVPCDHVCILNCSEVSNDWSHEETDDPLHADRRNFYKVGKWSRDRQRIEEMQFAGNSLAKAQRVTGAQGAGRHTA